MSDDDLSNKYGIFDFVHSVIVLQHMPVVAGMRVLNAMLRLLDPGGVGALHFTYARKASLLRRAMTPHDRAACRWYSTSSDGATEDFFVEIDHYDLSRVVAVLQRPGCTEIHAELTTATVAWAPSSPSGDPERCRWLWPSCRGDSWLDVGRRCRRPGCVSAARTRRHFKEE